MLKCAAFLFTLCIGHPNFVHNLFAIYSRFQSVSAVKIDAMFGVSIVLAPWILETYGTFFFSETTLLFGWVWLLKTRIIILAWISPHWLPQRYRVSAVSSGYKRVVTLKYVLSIKKNKIILHFDNIYICIYDVFAFYNVNLLVRVDRPNFLQHFLHTAYRWHSFLTGRHLLFSLV